ncbi:hypothetical protein HNO89_001980 [Sporosarcina luteola]|nr:hypothetical protein [Sporosarcina luteola]
MERLVAIYKDVIYQLLLTSNGRTTDILEVLAGDEIELLVVDQVADHVNLGDGQLTQCLIRESYIIIKKSEFILSHNFARVYPDFTPTGLHAKIKEKEQGIGSSMKTMEIPSTRRILASGWRKGSTIVDVQKKSRQLIFNSNDPVPFKEYEVRFEQNGHPGIHLIEYFNPDLLNALEIAVENPMEMYIK